ncbi:MAG: hypothetical protein ACYTG5_13495 [Planctomycetota bacterium]|jgi:hypothetical protein
MRTPFLIGAILMTSLSLQAQRSFFHVYPDPIDPALDQSSSFTDRGILNTGGAGEILAEMPSDMVSRLGSINQDECLFSAVEFVQQDELPVTQHQYNLIFRARHASGDGPDMTDDGLIAFAGPLTTPFSTSQTSLAWNTRITFTTPGPLPCESNFFYGLELEPAPSFPSDGQSVHMAHYELGTFGDWPRIDAPGLAWSFEFGDTVATEDPAVWDIALGTEAPSLQVGNDDPANPGGVNGTLSFGAGGFFPDVSGAGRNDGLVARVADNDNAGGFVFIFMNSGLNPSPFMLPGLGGVLAIDPGAGLRLLRNGDISDDPTAANDYAEVVLVPPGTPTLPDMVGQFVSLQAITMDAGLNLSSLHFSNAMVISL